MSRFTVPYASAYSIGSTVLSVGEMVFDTTNKVLRVGDGVTPAGQGVAGAGQISGSLTLGNSLAPTTVDLKFTSAGGSQTDALLRSTGGSSSVPYKATLVLAADTLNLQAKFTPYKPIILTYAGVPNDALYNAVGLSGTVTNTGGAGYGYRYNFTQQGSVTSGFSLAHAVLADFPGLNGGQGQALWLVAQTPTSPPTSGFGVAVAEFNPIQLSADTGYVRKRISSIRWSVGLQLVPESTNKLTGSTLGAYNATAGLVVARSSAVSSATSWYAQTYNPVLIEEDAVAPGGVGVQIAGSVLRTTAGTLPKFGTRVDAAWSDAAFDSYDAIITTNYSLRQKVGQRIAWLSAGGVEQACVDATRLSLIETASASITSPVAGSQTIFIDTADHKLKRKDSTGTVTIIG